jgi:hypothetical protein
MNSWRAHVGAGARAGTMLPTLQIPHDNGMTTFEIHTRAYKTG